MSKESELIRQSRFPTSNVIIIDKANFFFSSLYIILGFILILLLAAENKNNFSCTYFSTEVIQTIKQKDDTEK